MSSNKQKGITFTDDDSVMVYFYNAKRVNSYYLQSVLETISYQNALL